MAILRSLGSQRSQAGEVLTVRTLGPYPRGSRFDPDRRPCLLDAKTEGSFTCHVDNDSFGRAVPEQAHGPEALTVERPVETRQEEIRALLGPPTDAWRNRRRTCTTRRRLEVRALLRRETRGVSQTVTAPR